MGEPESYAHLSKSGTEPNYRNTLSFIFSLLFSTVKSNKWKIPEKPTKANTEEQAINDNTEGVQSFSKAKPRLFSFPPPTGRHKSLPTQTTSFKAVWETILSYKRSNRLMVCKCCRFNLELT